MSDTCEKTTYALDKIGKVLVVSFVAMNNANCSLCEIGSSGGRADLFFCPFLQVQQNLSGAGEMANPTRDRHLVSGARRVFDYLPMMIKDQDLEIP